MAAQASSNHVELPQCRLALTKLTMQQYLLSHHLIASLEYPCEGVEDMWWWLALVRKHMWWWISSFGKSYHGDVLQYTKQLFSLRLLQM